MFQLLKRIPLILAIPAIVIIGGWIIFQAGQNSTAKEIELISNAEAKDNTQKNNTTEDEVGISFHTVKAGHVNSQTIVGGTIIPARSVTLNAQSNGEIEFLAGREGDRFSTGNLLVKINADDLLARRRAAVAQLQNAQADIKNSEVQYQRELLSPSSKSLSKSGGMGMPMLFDQMFTRSFSNAMPNNIGGDTVLDRNADLHNVATQLNQAQGRYMQSRSQIDEIDTRISNANINAPFVGIILTKMVNTGDIVQAGAPLIQYADLSRLQIEAQVPASIVTRLSPNMILPVRLSGTEYESNARIEQIYPAADSQRRTVTVKMELPNNSGAIPGMYVEILLPSQKSDQQSSPVIPLSAVMFNGSLPTVRVLKENNQTQLRMVRLGERMVDKQVEIISGLRVGERIVDRP